MILVLYVVGLFCIVLLELMFWLCLAVLAAGWWAVKNIVHYTNPTLEARMRNWLNSRHTPQPTITRQPATPRPATMMDLKRDCWRNRIG